jgi:hypothetical protein
MSKSNLIKKKNEFNNKNLKIIENFNNNLKKIILKLSKLSKTYI